MWQQGTKHISYWHLKTQSKVFFVQLFYIAIYYFVLYETDMSQISLGPE